MKIGIADYGMNVWYGGCYDIEQRLLDLKKIGYDGIERLDEVASAAEALEKAALFHKHGMDFATCRGPNLQAGIRWTAALGKEYVWLAIGSAGSRDIPLFCRQSEEFAAACKTWGIKAIVHNHLGQACESQKNLEEFLDNAPNCGLLLDTGHLAAAGGDCFRTIEKYYDRIVAVHVKDYVFKNVKLGLDQWPERLRFCELGAGEMGQANAEILKLLKSKGYDGWVCVEHDTHLQEPLKDLAISREYLRKAGC